MIGVFEAGGSKTEFIYGVADAYFKKSASGIHPMFMDEQAIALVLEDLLQGVPHSDLSEIWFYGASCAGHELSGKVYAVLESFFPNLPLRVESDLLGTARALCGHNPGFAAILGTGSNACIYNGKDIESRMVSFGFWLGDEGSGGYLGKQVFRAWLKGELPAGLNSELASVFGTSQETALQSILQDPKPNARIARLGGLAIQQKENPHFSGYIRKSIEDFFHENASLVREAKDLPFHFSGSVAFYLQKEIKDVLINLGLKPGVFSDRTTENLFQYHL